MQSRYCIIKNNLKKSENVKFFCKNSWLINKLFVSYGRFKNYKLLKIKKMEKFQNSKVLKGDIVSLFSKELSGEKDVITMSVETGRSISKGLNPDIKSSDVIIFPSQLGKMSSVEFITSMLEGRYSYEIKKVNFITNSKDGIFVTGKK